MNVLPRPTPKSSEMPPVAPAGPEVQSPDPLSQLGTQIQESFAEASRLGMVETLPDGRLVQRRYRNYAPGPDGTMPRTSVAYLDMIANTTTDQTTGERTITSVALGYNNRSWPSWYVYQYPKRPEESARLVTAVATQTKHGVSIVPGAKRWDDVFWTNRWIENLQESHVRKPRGRVARAVGKLLARRAVPTVG
jgi:hypothetical protein